MSFREVELLSTAALREHVGPKGQQEILTGGRRMAGLISGGTLHSTVATSLEAGMQSFCGKHTRGPRILYFRIENLTLHPRF